MFHPLTGGIQITENFVIVEFSHRYGPVFVDSSGVAKLQFTVLQRLTCKRKLNSAKMIQMSCFKKSPNQK